MNYVHTYRGFIEILFLLSYCAELTGIARLLCTSGVTSNAVRSGVVKKTLGGCHYAEKYLNIPQNTLYDPKLDVDCEFAVSFVHATGNPELRCQTGNFGRREQSCVLASTRRKHFTEGHSAPSWPSRGTFTVTMSVAKASAFKMEQRA